MQNIHHDRKGLMKQKGFTPLEIASYHKKTRFVTGFTLTEVLIAMLLLSLAAAGMFAVFIAGRRFTVGGGRRFEALNFARETLEKLRDDVEVIGWGTDISGGSLSDGVHNDPLPAGDFKDKWGGSRSYEVNPAPPPVDVYGTGSIYRVVKVKVTWTEP